MPLSIYDILKDKCSKGLLFSLMHGFASLCIRMIAAVFNGHKKYRHFFEPYSFFSSMTLLREACKAFHPNITKEKKTTTKDLSDRKKTKETCDKACDVPV